MKTDDGRLILYSKVDVLSKIKVMVNKALRDGSSNLVIIMVLKGGVWTGMRMLEYMSAKDLDVSYGFVGFTSYGAKTEGSDKVICTYKSVFPDKFIEGKNVLIVDDVIQRGLTMFEAHHLIKKLNPATVRQCALVDKRESDLSKPDFSGFHYEGGKFIVGCGMGLGEKYRNDSFISILGEDFDVGTGL